MFHDGDLQSGIALAVQQSKAVLCFVQGVSVIPSLTCQMINNYTDDEANSQRWERIVLDDERVSPMNPNLISRHRQTMSGCSSNTSECCRLANTCWLPRSQISLPVLSNRRYTYCDHHTVSGFRFGVK